MRRVLGVFAKQPIAGHSKTRLAQTTSAAWAERVAVAFLHDSLDRFASVDAECVLVYWPESAGGFFAKAGQDRYRLQVQSAGDLGQRLRHFFSSAHHDANTHAIAVGSDSPTLPIAYIETAFQLLATHDVVLGPAQDGGYYLVGMKQMHEPLFVDIPWSSASVLEKTVQQVTGESVSLAILPVWYDVDTEQDWAMMRGHIRAMRRAGIDPGAPRVERLMAEPEGSARGLVDSV
jgi:rSAM/selenodomain-associated transferase 1